MTESEFHIRPIEQGDLEQVADICWENRQTQERLLQRQEILGIGAWEGANCVGQLHCYRVDLPEYNDSDFPGYGRSRPVSWPLGWPLVAAVEQGLSFDRPVWGHACFHVGFTPGAHKADPAYFGRGIGTAMLHASVQWARDHDYAAVIAQGGTKAAAQYNVWMGCLPWTTYAATGFTCVATEENGRQLPWWAKGEASPEVMEQVQEATAAGHGPDELCTRLMVLEL